MHAIVSFTQAPGKPKPRFSLFIHEKQVDGVQNYPYLHVVVVERTNKYIERGHHGKRMRINGRNVQHDCHV